eukprot:6699362-Alexandrium_andersonii.AAC.1
MRERATASRRKKSEQLAGPPSVLSGSGFSMAKPTPRFTRVVASLMLWRAKYVPRRTCSYSAGLSCSFGRPYR